MAVGKGGSSNNQRQNQSGSYNSQGTSTPIAPEGWEAAWNGFAPGANGFVGPQQGAVDWMSGQLNSGDPANLQFSSDYFKDALANRAAPTLRNLAELDPAYAAPASVAAQQIAARRGSEFMGDYQNPFLDQVLESSLSDFDVGTDRAANAFRAQSIAGGTTGGAYGSNPVGAAILAGEAARGRGALGAGIRSNAFNTAAGLGMQDAGRYLAADQSNQQANLAADTFNANLLNNRQQFDANLGMAYNDQRDRTAMNLANLGTTGFGVGQGLASGLFDAGTTGQGQNMQWLAAGTPLFGQQNTESGSTVGSSTGSSKGKSGGLSLS